MKFKYVEAYRVKGLVGPSDERQIINDKDIKAYLVSDPDQLLNEIDRRTAIANIMLTAVFIERPPRKTEDLINAQVVEIRKQRKKGGDGYLVIEIEGELIDYHPSVERENEGLHIAFDAIDKDKIRIEFEHKIKGTIAALSLLSDKIIGVEKVSDGVLLYNDDAKIIYPFTPKGGVASLHISSPLSASTIENIAVLFYQILKHIELGRVIELLVSSLKSREDSLRAFLSSWTALEIFINKTFPKFEVEFFTELKAGDHPEIREKYLNRIRSVMSDKYKISDKFSVVALRLSSKSADNDVILFNKIKKQRDLLTHGQNIADRELEVEATQKLLTYYLYLFLNFRN